VTPTCDNYFEKSREITYFRIAVIDTGSQKLSDRFQEAFDFIGKFYVCNMHYREMHTVGFNPHEKLFLD